MKKITLITALAFICLSVGAQTWDWAKKAAGGTNNDYGESIATDKHGNVYVTGYYSSSTIVFGSVTLTGFGSSSIFIVKYDPNGNVLWAKRQGGAGMNLSNSIATDSNDNVYIAGQFAGSTITFGSTTLTNASFFRDLFIAKYDSAGNVLWAKREGGSTDDGANSVSTDPNGNVYMAGWFKSPSITIGTSTLTNAGTVSDIFVVKYDSSGNTIWAKSAGGNNEDIPYGIAADMSGNAYVTGYYYNSPITFGNTTLTNAGSYDIFIVKYDSAGNVAWAKGAGGSNQDGGMGITTDASGNAYVTGFFAYQTVVFGSTTLTSNGGDDVFTVKYDAAGNVLWAKNGGGSSTDQGNGIAVDANGNTYVTGSFVSTSAGFDNITINNANGVWYKDVFIVEYSPTGNAVWAKSGGGGGNATEFSEGIAIDTSGNMYITGYFAGDTSVFNTTKLINQNWSTYDIFIAKMGPPAKPVSSFSVSGSTTTCAGNVVAFMDQSANSPTSWSWSFSGGTPNTSTLQNPTVTYNVAGTYDVTLIAANGGGSNTLTKTNYITVKASPSIPIITPGGATTFCQGGSVTLAASSANSYLWNNGVTAQSIIVNSTGNYSVTIDSANGCSATSATTAVTVNSLPNATITSGGTTTFCQGGSVTLTANSASSYLWSNNAVTQSITVTSGGNYTVTVTDNNGCSATSAPTTVTVNSLPNATITSGGTTTFCQGGSVILTANSASSYSWSNSATTPSITVTSAGNYTVTVTGNNGCSATSPATAVTVNSNPITPVISQNGLLLTSSSASGNQWYYNNTVITGAVYDTLTAVQNGSYTVIITDSNTCSSDTSNVITINNVGIKEIAATNSISIFPNPASDNLIIDFKPQSKNAGYEIYDVFGRVILKSQILNPQSLIQVNELSEGLYMLRITDGESVYNKKLVKE